MELMAADLPLEAVATCRRPADAYTELRALGVHERAGGWVVARDEHLAAALCAPELSVVPSVPTPGPLGELQRRMARFSDGADHRRRRGIAQELLPDARTVEPAALARTTSLLAGQDGRVDAMPLARTVPVAVLAAALGVDGGDVDRVGQLVGALCELLAPAADVPAPRSADPDVVVAELTGRFAELVPGDADEIAAAIGLLFQARDATAALIGSAVAAPISTAVDDPNYWVEWAVRQDAPVQCTKRVAGRDWSIDGVVVPAGATVWLMLAARGDDPGDAPATFGAGVHGCPGAGLALALARGVVSGIRAGGWRAVPGQPIELEPRPNLRLPRVVLIERG